MIKKCFSAENLFGDILEFGMVLKSNTFFGNAQLFQKKAV